MSPNMFYIDVISWMRKVKGNKKITEIACKI